METKTKIWIENYGAANVRTINFSANWGEKLSLPIFTTLRIWKPERYRKGDLIRIELQGKFICYAGIMMLEKIELAKLTDAQLNADTGMSRKDSYHLFEKFYGKKFLEKSFACIYLKVISRDAQEVLKLLYGASQEKLM